MKKLFYSPVLLTASSTSLAFSLELTLQSLELHPSSPINSDVYDPVFASYGKELPPFVVCKMYGKLMGKLLGHTAKTENK